MAGNPPDQRGPVLFLVLLMLVGLLVIAWGVNHPAEDAGPSYEGSYDVVPSDAPTTPDPGPSASAGPSEAPEPLRPAHRDELPGGGTTVFGGNHFLVAYYGTGQTSALGVLGETEPDVMDRRLHRAAAPYRRPGQPVRHVYELIVTIADGSPGPDGDYSHDIPRAEVERYIRAAHRQDALLLLDLQPGRSSFPDVARRWRWALEDPWVGLALDPEWRMGPRQVPGRTIGSVTAAEINRTSAWLARLTHRGALPEKVFVVHQFRVDMVRGIDRVHGRRGLATVQHVDGFGTPRQKLATYHAVARPRQFTMGFKLFYDEDVRRLQARAVQAIRPRVRFVSFQ